MKKKLSRAPQRFEVQMTLQYRERGSSDWFNAKVINLSEGGMCLEMELTPPAPYTDLELAVNSKDQSGKNRRRLIRALVMWRRGSRAGIQFELRAGTR